MSEKINNEDVLCGAIYENGEYVPVYCNRVTGECYFADPVMSYNRLISELSVDDPIEVDFPDTVEAIVSGSFGECLGVIYNGERTMRLLRTSLWMSRSALVTRSPSISTETTTRSEPWR